MSLSRQIRALRATAAALLAQLEALEDAVEAAVPDACDHPERDRDKKVATFDSPDRWMCRRCGHIGGEKAAKE